MILTIETRSGRELISGGVNVAEKVRLAYVLSGSRDPRLLTLLSGLGLDHQVRYRWLAGYGG
jgi:hypothetical protein